MGCSLTWRSRGRSPRCPPTRPTGRIYNRPVRCLGACAAAASLLVIAGPARAAVVADVGRLQAAVPAYRWSLTLERRDRATVLAEYPRSGRGPNGRLGFRMIDGVWHHATRLVRARRHGGGYSATLAVDASKRLIQVRIAPEAEAVIGLNAHVTGPPRGLGAIGIAFRATPASATSASASARMASTSAATRLRTTPARAPTSPQSAP
jgi:hypothetical protein